jgi:ABC-2 type transport system permease protein
MLRGFFNHRLLALMRKEFNQIRRDTRIVMSLIVPPGLLLLLFGLVLNSKIENVRLGVIDQSGTSESRELIADLSVSRSFRLTRGFLSPSELSDAVTDGRVQAGLIIPAEFSRDLEKGRQANVQFVLNAMDANTATVANTYAQGVVSAYGKGVRGRGVHVRFDEAAAGAVARPGGVELQPSFLYNPGLFAAWFTVTGVLGLLCIVNSSLVASEALVKEREAGTIEQLLMSPATTTEIIVAKIAPLFASLCVMVVILAVGIGRVVFGVPFNGGVLPVFAGAALCLLGGIGIGTFLATFTRSAYQTQLASFFINPPLAFLSGAVTPVEAMPAWLRPVTELNPIYHFGVIARGSMLKGSGLETLWPNYLALALIALALLTLSIIRFRKQLA